MNVTSSWAVGGDPVPRVDGGPQDPWKVHVGTYRPVNGKYSGDGSFAGGDYMKKG